ncbi:uncharacterized protein LOC129304144 [Prosopis cineraria]|uniref:uncharacterized protein LOC129304144 n=1 Tax=Prosopis cineraria TaxID=364024 RepID=UPI00240FEF49|nr:uncharacterized protein LOC129304144 [Prosopis cineraria]
MEIPQILFKFKYHFIAGLLLALTVSSFAVLAPRFLTVLAYFWPLFLSTALFLALVLVFGRTSSAAAAGGNSNNNIAGEVFLDYVAGHHELQLESQASRSD